MKKAFTPCSPNSAEPEEDDDFLDDPELWNDLPMDEEERLNVTFTFKSHHRLQCFANTLHNWLLVMVLKRPGLCDYQTLCKVLDVRGHRQTAQIKELVSILKPFADATDLTQEEKVVTISAVIPCVLSLNHLKENQIEEAQYLVNQIHSLQISLQRKFKGIFVNVKMSQPETNK
ncbi:Glutamate--tRNA ligase [Labeo rohita]|uniref:Glutamate--tRNA ligase n=1 Tax=Labeo rohita TaxID=84645 RepID=A0ABQ8L159_LABRO|nr:Glutamate--tRNA ligase [Labeo rohita]